MIDVMIEQWNNLDGTTEYQWSVWRDGSRMKMDGPFATGDAAEQAAFEYCDLNYGAERATITRL